MAARNENEFQEQFFAWMTTIRVLGYPEHTLRNFAFAIPNGVQLAGTPRKRAIYMTTLKRRGLTPGVSDICIALPRGAFHGMFLELKHGSNGMTTAQTDFQKLMGHAGYATACVKTLEYAKDIVGLYLNSC